MQITVDDLDWIVVSLERTPDRLARFKRDSAAFDLPIDLVEATDGRETSFDELAALDLLVPGRMGGWDADGVGNALTHWMCWHQVIESGRPTCIFEDVAQLRADFVERTLQLAGRLPAGWDIAQLGYNTDSAIEMAIVADSYFQGGFSGRYDSEAERAAFAQSTGPAVPLRLRHAFGSFAYLVSPAGAQKLIDGCFPLAGRYFPVGALGHKTVRSTTIDGVMNTIYGTLQAYMAFPPLAIRVRDPVASAEQPNPAQGT